MDEKYVRIERFLGVLGALIEGKFTDAETRIRESLAALAESRELTNLFTAITQDFDYPAAKRAYLRFPAAPGSAHGQAYLPTDRSEILAFVFCLLVEIDAGKVQFSDFLLRYFYVDGSYTASYSVFSDRVIRPFYDIVSDCFPGAAKFGSADFIARQEKFALLRTVLKNERIALAKYDILDDDKTAGDSILSAALAALGRGDSPTLVALLAGYHYFLSVNAVGGENSDKLMEIAAEL